MQSSSRLNPLLARLGAISPRLKRALWKQLYELLAARFQSSDWTCMNYGYAALGETPHTVAMDAGDEGERYPLQLYRHVVGDAVLSGNALLEVGSGRGGGIAFLARTLGTSRAVGVDYSEQAVRLARRLNQAPGLSYEVGDAEALPLADCSFDAVVNVESSHCYASMERFLAEVRRVLKPAGMFYWADMRPEGAIEAARRQFADAGFALVSEGEITRNVLRSLDLVSTARLARIRRGVPRFLQPALADFAGVAGTRVYESLRTGEVRYLSCTLQRDG